MCYDLDMPRRRKAGEESGKRNIVMVPLVGEADGLINRLCDRTGSSKTRMIQRLVEWFALTPEALQQMIIGTVPAEMRSEYARIAGEFMQKFAAQGQWPFQISGAREAIEQAKAAFATLAKVPMDEQQRREVERAIKTAEESLKPRPTTQQKKSA
jgi:hypothetical protein